MNSITLQPFADKLEIQQWIRDLKQDFIDENTNECGSGWNEGIVPDTFFTLVNSGLYVGGICNIHDLEYKRIVDLLEQGTIDMARAEQLRLEADNRLKDNLHMLVECQYIKDKTEGSWSLFFWRSRGYRAQRARAKRNGWASAYYWTVRKCGASAIK